MLAEVGPVISTVGDARPTGASKEEQIIASRVTFLTLTTLKCHHLHLRTAGTAKSCTCLYSYSIKSERREPLNCQISWCALVVVFHRVSVHKGCIII